MRFYETKRKEWLSKQTTLHIVHVHGRCMYVCLLMQVPRRRQPIGPTFRMQPNPTPQQLDRARLAGGRRLLRLARLTTTDSTLQLYLSLPSSLPIWSLFNLHILPSRVGTSLLMGIPIYSPALFGDFFLFFSFFFFDLVETSKFWWIERVWLAKAWWSIWPNICQPIKQM